MTHKPARYSPTTRLTGAELATVRENLGLTVEALAAYCEVDPRTVRKWERQRNHTPTHVTRALQRLEDVTASAVADVVAGLDPTTPRVEVWRGQDADSLFAAAYPQFGELGARWWRMVAYRVAEQVPRARIGTRVELEELDGG